VTEINNHFKAPVQVQICRQDLVSLALTDEGVSADRWEVDSPNMPTRPSGTISHHQACISRTMGGRITKYASKALRN
jgi:hypothetical protein